MNNTQIEQSVIQLLHCETQHFGRALARLLQTSRNPLPSQEKEGILTGLKVLGSQTTCERIEETVIPSRLVTLNLTKLKAVLDKIGKR